MLDTELLKTDRVLGFILGELAVDFLLTWLISKSFTVRDDIFEAIVLTFCLNSKSAVPNSSLYLYSSYRRSCSTCFSLFSSFDSPPKTERFRFDDENPVL